MVVLDSINGYLNAMPEKAFLNLQLHELLTVLNQRGVITIMLLAQQGVIGNMQTVVDLTYLADTVIMLSYFESRGEVQQAVSIIKKRSGDHERTIREMKIGGAGITVGEPLRELHGVLTGVPSFERGKSSARCSRVNERRGVRQGATGGPPNGKRRGGPGVPSQGRRSGYCFGS